MHGLIFIETVRGPLCYLARKRRGHLSLFVCLFVCLFVSFLSFFRVKKAYPIVRQLENNNGQKNNQKKKKNARESSKLREKQILAPLEPLVT